MPTILNDLHIGARRKAGTTPESQAALRRSIVDGLAGLLELEDDWVIINGDIFDGFEVEFMDLLDAFNRLCGWLNGSSHRILTLVAGNHDWNPRADKISSFHVLAHVLTKLAPKRVQVIDSSDGFCALDHRLHAISHQPNQELFNIEIERAINDGVPGGYLLLHANYENEFAEHADHSLNVFAEQADRLVAAGWTLVFGHEHQGREARDGRVLITGNQIVTSVADCLGNDHKRCLRITDTGHEWVKLNDVAWFYMEVDWKDLVDNGPEVDFIRVTGEATAEQAADVVNAVAKLRQNSSAFVITNAVKIDGIAEMDSLAELSLEEVSTFNVREALLAELTEEERVVVKELLG